jgi:hypothetical protein
MKSVPCMLSMHLDVHLKTVENSLHTEHTQKIGSTYAQFAMKLFPLMLSVR